MEDGHLINLVTTIGLTCIKMESMWEGEWRTWSKHMEQ